MKTAGRIILIILDFLDRAVSAVMILFCCILFLLGFYSLLDTYYLYRGADTSSILRFRPENKEQIQTLYEELKGSVSWLTLDGTGVDDPVMQGKDNLEYLNKNPYGEFSLSGSLFLDSRNSPAFTDPYSLIYGHHMDHNMMFGALDQYKDPGFLETHTEGHLYVNADIYELEVFAVLTCSAYEESVFTPGEADRVKEFILANAEYLRETDPDSARILGLSTCAYPDTGLRTVVFALIKDQERSRK